MIEKFKDLIFALDEKGLIELYKMCKIRYFELYIDNNNEYVNRYKYLCKNIRKELTNRGIWK